MTGSRLAPPAHPLRLAALLAAALLVTHGCGGGDLAPPETPIPYTGEPQPGGTVLLGVGSDLDSLNPYLSTQALTRDVAYHVFASLLEEQPDFAQGPPSFEPALAQSWGVSPDGRQITFHLRPDAVWSDGVPVTANDVRFSWQAAVHPDVAWLGADAKKAIEDVEVVDAHTARFHFRRVYPYQLMDANDGVILPRHIWGQVPFASWRGSGLDRQPVSSGPFKVNGWEPGQSITLVRNPDYFGAPRPYLDRVVYRILPDPASGVEQLLAGVVDFWDKIDPSQMARLESRPEVTLHRYPDNFYGYLMWNCVRPPFDDPGVRLALTLGINRRRLAEDLLHGAGQVASGPIPPLFWAHNAGLTSHPHDPAGARRRLAAAGWSDTDGDGWLDRGGRSFRFEILVPSDSTLRQDMAVMIQADLKAVGIDVRPVILERNTQAARSRAGQFDATIGGWRLPTKVDLGIMFATRAAEDGVNYGRYSSAELDELLRQAAEVEDFREAKPLLDAAQAILHRDQPYTFLYWQDRLVGISSRVQGAAPNPHTPLFRLERWWVPSELRDR